MPTPSDCNNKDNAPEDRPTTAQKTPLEDANEKGANQKGADKKKAREARLAGALRDNLRRRKAGGKKDKDD